MRNIVPWKLEETVPKLLNNPTFRKRNNNFVIIYACFYSKNKTYFEIERSPSDKYLPVHFHFLDVVNYF